MLGYYHLTKGTLANPVSDPVELLSGDHRLVQLMELVHDVGNDVLLVFKKRVIRLCLAIIVLI